MINSLKLLYCITALILSASCAENKKLNPPLKAIDNSSSVARDTGSQLGNNIMVIYQDNKGNYWFGSWKTGLYKYDGKTIINYTTKDGLPNNRVEEIKEDEFGNIIINTPAGFVKYDGKLLSPINEAMPQNLNWKLRPNDLWFKSQTHGHVYRFDGNTLHNLKIPETKLGQEYMKQHPNNSNPYDVYCTYKDSKGNVWFGTALLGAFRYNGKSFDWIEEADVTELHDGPSNGVRSIAEDKNGDFWFNTNYLYKVYDHSPSSQTETHTQPFYKRIKSIGNLDGKSLGNLSEYLSIVKDNSDNLWMATYLDGVWKYDGVKVHHYPIEANGKPIPLFYLYKDKKGDIWLGTQEDGVYKLHGDTFHKFRP